MSGLSRTFILLNFAVKITFNKLVRFLSRTIIPRMKMTVVLKQGTLQGKQYQTLLSNKHYVSFLGVPYAKPPVGDLRFLPPVEHPGWNNVLNAFSDGNKCLQYSIIDKKVTGSEDCLYLNIFVPQEGLEENKPVMVFIHGGAFSFGSGSSDEYSPDYLLDENVIVITINYRLNALGFLNFDIDECSGNMGLKDQVFALKWIKANVSAFGGDADNITIFGESAGSASVHYHILSQQSTGLFQKAIMQSGCAFNSFTLNEKHRETASKLAKYLGCEKDDPKEIIRYLKSVPATDLVTGAKLANGKDFLHFEFVPSVESNAISDPFLPAHPKTLAKTASPVPLISGVNNMEGLIALGEKRMGELINFHKTNEISAFFKGKYSEDIIKKVTDFYFNEHNVENETTRLENICHFYSDIYFFKEFHDGYSHLLEQGATVYCYEFKYDGEINTIKNLIFGTRPTLRKSLKGACHADELSYLFYGQLFGFAPKADSPESRMCKTMSKLWTNFAKTGNPNSSDVNFVWNSTSIDDRKYLSLDGDDTCMVDGLLYSSRVNLWKNILEIVQSV